MEKIIFSETNIFILSKLVAIVRREHGSRHRLSTEEAVDQLIIEASMSESEDVQKYYHLFLKNLHAQQVQRFKLKGALIPDEMDVAPGILPPPIRRQYAFTAH